MTPTAELIQARLEAAFTRPCLLCGGLPWVAGVFTPNQPEEWGAPSGKRRYLFFSLCLDCFDINPVERGRRVEDTLETGLLAARAPARRRSSEHAQGGQHAAEDQPICCARVGREELHGTHVLSVRGQPPEVHTVRQGGLRRTQVGPSQK